ncbi:RNA polymerase sigma factor [Nonomuraea sp. NPDC001699]
MENLLRELVPRVLGALVRRYGNFATAEDAVQEALIAAAAQWPDHGVPDNPAAWLIRVASRRMTDLLRNEQARRRREDTVAGWVLPEQRRSPAADQAHAETDDTLILLFLCCHPALSGEAQVALTLRAVGGLSTAEIARAFLVSEQTMTRRISRAKLRIRDSGLPFAMPSGPERADRLAAVLHALYLIFNEGYVSTAGPHLQRVELASEAIRLTRFLHRMIPDDGEVTGLLALMLLTDARRPARTGTDGRLIPMAEQDRSLWRAEAIAEGVALVTAALPRGVPGPYQLQAAIAAVHGEAPSAEQTDWPQILRLYELLLRHGDNPVMALNHAVAAAMVHGPQVALPLVEAVAGDPRMSRDHRVPAVRAHLLELAGEPEAACEQYREAARRTLNPPQQRYLNDKAARLRQ